MKFLLDEIIARNSWITLISANTFFEEIFDRNMFNDQLSIDHRVLNILTEQPAITVVSPSSACGLTLLFDSLM